MAISDEVREAVASTNFKNLGEAPAFYASLAMKSAVAHQDRVHTLSEGYLGQALKSMVEVDPTEALAHVKQLTGNDLAKQLADLSAVLAQIQQGIKAAQTTPPTTHG